MDKIIKQNFKVEFDYNISFSENIFSLSNPLLSNLLNKTNTQNNSKSVVIIDKGVFDHHPSLISSIKSYFKKCCSNTLLMVC